MSVELDMIQRDTNAPMIPIHLDAMQPGIAYLASIARDSDSPIGRLQQIVMERATDDRSDEQVRATLARDALLLRELVGGFDKVGAMQAGDDKSLANLSVHLTGASGVIARWSVGPISDFHGATLTLVGEDGRLTLRMPKEAAWELDSTTTPAIESLGNRELQADPATALIQQIERGLDGEPIRPTWEDAFRCTDLADVASESIRRGKTLSVSNARVTEEYVQEHDGCGRLPDHPRAALPSAVRVVDRRNEDSLLENGHNRRGQESAPRQHAGGS